jgi:NitT/TauT family transport system substrate-binding protein
MRTTALVGLVGGALALAGCGGDDDAADAEAGAPAIVRIGYGSASGGAMSVKLGMEQGYFGEEDINVGESTVENAAARIAAVQSGTVGATQVPTPTFIGALEQGLGLHAIAPEYGYPEGADTTSYENIEVMVGPDSDAQDAGDLDGATISVPTRKDLMEILATSEIAANGGDPESVDWVALDFQSQVAALKAGRVDAVTVPFPFTLMVKDFGGRTLSTPAGEFFEATPTTIWVVNDDVAANPDLVERLERAIYRSNAYANAHPDEVFASSSKRTGIPLDVLEAGGAATYFPLILDAAALQHTADKMRELGFLGTDLDIAEHVLPQIDTTDLAETGS